MTATLTTLIGDRARLYLQQQVPPGTTLWWGQDDDGEHWSFAPLHESDYPGLRNLKTLEVTEAHLQQIPIVAIEETLQLVIINLWDHGYQGLQVDPDGEVWPASFLGGNPQKPESWEVPYQLV
ncbi:hypothetical protein NEA10_12615 [Phormidium yuhuli AB48]|uniref:Uncharacterized protein n=1 Tax=Phormidium yuhuli AB48 TaxID=2940671 RepID=A0ABY5AL45_9CYAN|nr:hypothetical protein [Phormidium yuhuli]USR89720.1 hypothetical protein NEA10_12615 [Phormidium yuhuli AB48]